MWPQILNLSPNYHHRHVDLLLQLLCPVMWKHFVDTTDEKRNFVVCPAVFFLLNFRLVVYSLFILPRIMFLL